MLPLKLLSPGLKISNRLSLEPFKQKLSALPGSLQDSYFRTDEADPSNHNINHLGRLYTVDPQIPKLFGKELSPREFYNANSYFAPRQWIDRCNVFNETAIMIRSPALQIMNCIKNCDLDKPAVRYLLFGRHGCGKSITLAHLTHFGHQEGFIVMTFGLIKKWLTKHYEVAPSTYTPGSIDHLHNSNIFLKNFRQANSTLLSNPKLVTHREYVWSVREKTPAGAPLSDVLNVGIERLPFSADALNVVIRELKLNCNNGNCKLMIVCDGVNALFADTTLVHKEKTKCMHGPYDAEWMQNVAKVDECSVLKNMKKLFCNDYKNSVIVASACAGATVKKTDPGARWWKSKQLEMKPDLDSHLPFSLLGEEGWRLLDPFLPVEVEPYTESELDTMIDYYVERGYLGKECDSRSARQEIHFLTGRNPGDFFKFSSSF